MHIISENIQSKLRNSSENVTEMFRSNTWSTFLIQKNRFDKYIVRFSFLIQKNQFDKYIV